MSVTLSLLVLSVLAGAAGENEGDKDGSSRAVNPSVGAIRLATPNEKIIRQAHAVPPVGWRRTRQGWELFEPEPQYHNVGPGDSESWFVVAATQVRRVPPPLIAIAMLITALLPAGINRLVTAGKVSASSAQEGKAYSTA